MSGFPGWVNETFFDGWYQETTEGIANLYITIVDEGIVTSVSDEPSSTVYHAKILSPDTFSIKHSPAVWTWGDTSIQLAAFGQLQLENYDAFYSGLVLADLRDCVVTFKIPEAMAMGIDGLIEGAPIIATAIIDTITCDNEDVITITLKDTLALLDKTLPVRINPPFVDSGAANRPVPLSFGACHNVAPLPTDEENRIFEIHDAPLTNITAARDGGAPLDANASPPQYTGALSGSGIQLQTLTTNKFTVDCSTIGAQATIPGSQDVLAGAGTFDGFSGSPSVPAGWDWSNLHGTSAIGEKGLVDGYPFDNICYIASPTSFAPVVSKYGDQLTTETTVLEQGKAYRFYLKIFSTFSGGVPFIGGQPGGIMVRSALTNNAADAISPHGISIVVPFFGEMSFVWSFRVPHGSDRKIYIMAVNGQATLGGDDVANIGGGYIYDAKLELLGEYLEIPLEGTTLAQYFREIIVGRSGFNATIYNAADLAALDEATGYKFGNHYDEAPNILQSLRDVLDSYCGTLWTDAQGVIRCGRLTDPKSGTPIADFDETNMARPISFSSDGAPNLTTVIGTTRNWSPLTDSDFLTDYDAIPQAVRTRFSKTSQYTRTASMSPAGEYNFSKFAPVFHSLLDDPDDGQNEIDRVVGIYSPQIYSDGTITTGKRRFVSFTAFWEDPEAVGATIKCAVTDLMFGQTITINYPRHGFSNTSAEIVAWEIFPFAKKIILTCIC